MKKKKGQALVETALVIPILLLFFCGIIDFGRILYAQSRLNLICQESVRLASFGKGQAEIYNYAYGKLDSNTAPTLIVDMDPEVESDRRSGTYVTVILSCDINYITPLVNYVLEKPFKAQASSTIRIE